MVKVSDIHIKWTYPNEEDANYRVVANAVVMSSEHRVDTDIFSRTIQRDIEGCLRYEIIKEIYGDIKSRAIEASMLVRKYRGSSPWCREADEVGDHLDAVIKMCDGN